MRSLVYLHVKAMFVYRGRVFRALLVVVGGIGMAKVGQGAGAARFGIWERMGTGHLSTHRGNRPALHCVPVPATQDQVSFLCSPLYFCCVHCT